MRFTSDNVEQQLNLDIQQYEAMLEREEFQDFRVVPHIIRDCWKNFGAVMELADMTEFFHRYDEYVKLTGEGRLNTSEKPNLIILFVHQITQLYKTILIDNGNIDKFFERLRGIPLKYELKALVSYVIANVLTFISLKDFNLMLFGFNKNLEMEIIDRAKKILVGVGQYAYVNTEEVNSNPQLKAKLAHYRFYPLSKEEGETLYMFLELARINLYTLILNNPQFLEESGGVK